MEIKMAEIFGSEGMKNLHLRGALVLTGPEAEASVLAVKNHDRLVEENKRLRQMLKCAVKVANDPNATHTAIQILNIESQNLLSEIGGEKDANRN
ncbi:hypothetical protein CGT81_16500 [Vibrio cholerae]|uniref:hypothetical protein n=1 Tax=Vibrio cholerae TaxID=666 RepID=UPI000BA997A4|nr:hypothetical protein [Vibrio cholerae]PAR95648.1 hypothetical protein CGT81_16500 [Vibrio cholerae]